MGVQVDDAGHQRKAGGIDDPGRVAGDVAGVGELGQVALGPVQPGVRRCQDAFAVPHEHGRAAGLVVDRHRHAAVAQPRGGTH